MDPTALSSGNGAADLARAWASRLWGLQPWQVWSVIEWCGHRIEGIPVPDVDGRWRLIVVEGEAR